MKKRHVGLLGLATLAVLGGVVACSPLQTLNTLSPGSALRSGDNIAYGSNARHTLDIYTPEDAKGQAPVVVFFFGGNWTKGEREDYAFVGRALAGRG